MPLAVHLVRFIYISSGNMKFEQKEYVVGYICIFSIIYGMGLPYPAYLLTNYVKRRKFLCSKGNFLEGSLYEIICIGM
jgi:hypothetical protein